MFYRLIACFSFTAMLLGFSAASAEPAQPAATETLTTATLPGLQPLELALPKKIERGTPKNYKSPNLEPQRIGARPTYHVPAGTVLLSKGKKVTASDDAPFTGKLEMITDQDKEGSDGSFVELSFGKQYVQIDLEQRAQITAVALWHFHAEKVVFHDVIVQISDDPEFASGVTTLFNNDNDNSAGLGLGQDKEYYETYEGKLIDGKGAKGRYLRLYSNGNTANDMNQYIEVEVYGKPLA